MKIIITNQDKNGNATSFTEIEFDDNIIGHQICLGIRKGLFGRYAGEDQDISTGAHIIADSLEIIAKALEVKNETHQG